MYGLIFDCDGVLGDTEGPICEAAIQAFRDLYAVEFAPAEFAPFIGTGSVRYVEGPAAARGLAIDTERVLHLVHTGFETILQSGRNIAFPGAKPLIEAARREPLWKIAIATSSPQAKSRLTLQAAGIDLAQFHTYVNGDMVTHKKPDPEIYLATAERLGIAPDHCVVVEDAINGVQAAKAAGMGVAAVTTSFPREALGEADLVAESLEELTLESLKALIPAHRGN